MGLGEGSEESFLWVEVGGVGWAYMERESKSLVDSFIVN